MKNRMHNTQGRGLRKRDGSCGQGQSEKRGQGQGKGLGQGDRRGLGQGKGDGSCRALPGEGSGGRRKSKG